MQLYTTVIDILEVDADLQACTPQHTGTKAVVFRPATNSRTKTIYSIVCCVLLVIGLSVYLVIDSCYSLSSGLTWFVEFVEFVSVHLAGSL